MATSEAQAKKSPIQDAFEEHQYDFETANTKARSWYDGEVRKLRRKQYTPNRIMRGSPEDLRTRIRPGFMYMYIYDAETKKDLPYYDRFPCVLVMRVMGDGFVGLNLHYLPYYLRFILLDRLWRFRSNTRMDETTRMRFTWETIAGVAKYRAAVPCVKRYKYSRLRSQFRIIEINDWATAMLLPVENFRKASKENVWQDSKRKMIGS
jgi:hypothetical protein